MGYTEAVIDGSVSKSAFVSVADGIAEDGSFDQAVLCVRENSGLGGSKLIDNKEEEGTNLINMDRGAVVLVQIRRDPWLVSLCLT